MVGPACGAKSDVASTAERRRLRNRRGVEGRESDIMTTTPNANAAASTAEDGFGRTGPGRRVSDGSGRAAAEKIVLPRPAWIEITPGGHGGP